MNQPKRSARALGATLLLSGVLYHSAGGALSIQDDAKTPSPVETATQSQPADLDETTEPVEPSPPVDEQVVPAGATAPTVAPEPARGVSDAERVARLERSIKANTAELETLQRQVEEPDSEYRQAEMTFNELDRKLKATQDALKEAEQAGQDEEAATLRDELEDLQTQWQVAKDRFELEVRERKAINERIEILKKSIASDEQALKELLGETVAAPPEAEAEAEAKPETPEPAPAAEPAAPSTAPTPAPTLPGMPALPTPTPEAGTSEVKKEEPKPKELIQAEKQVEKKAEVAERTELRSRSLDERLEQIDQSIANQRELLQTAQLKADNARKARDLLTQQFRDKSIEGADPNELRQLRDQIQQAERLVTEATAEVRTRTERLDELREERQLIADARDAVVREAAQARRELEMAQERVEQLQNPFSPRNISRWVVQRGPAMLAILIGTIVLYWIVGQTSRRIARFLATRGSRGTLAEREDRADTLVRVVHNAASIAIIVGGGIALLDTAGVPIAPLLGGAAVVGLAVAFGAQNLIRDFFSGFMILLENQYKLNDVVTINSHSGQVEQITLRMTALRDLEGNLHFMPNGEITSVINMTHGWSRALFDIGVAYKENVDRVMDVIMTVGKEMRKDPRFRTLILEDPTMLGVDAFADSAVMIKFFIKTRPMQQWTVKRELLRRLKNRFDELGIEIPFPHRTVFHRTDENGINRMVIEAKTAEGEGGNGFPA